MSVRFASGESDTRKLSSGITEHKQHQETRNLGELFREAMKGQSTHKQRHRTVSRRPTSIDTGIRYVHIVQCSDCKQGFTWRYSKMENNHKSTVQSTDLKTLKKRVKEQKLPWSIYNENAYRKTLKKANLTREELDAI